MSLRLLGPASAVAALAVLCATPGLAQALDPEASVSAATASFAFDPDETQTVRWTVTNSGPLDATAAVTLQVPTGWTATLPADTASFALAAGASRAIEVPVALAADAPQDGSLVLSATMRDGAGRVSPAASAPVALTFVPPVVPPAPRDYTAEIAWSVAGAVALLTVAAASAAYVTRAKQVALVVDPAQRPISTGTDGIFLVQVENRGRVRRDVELRVDGLPGTWHGAFSFPKVSLQPGERSPVPLCVKVPRAASDGHQVQITLRARPSGRFPWLVHATTNLEAHDRVRIGPAPVPETPEP